jgi:hypothetical protein
LFFSYKKKASLSLSLSLYLYIFCVYKFFLIKIMTISNTKTSVIEKSEEFLPTVPSQASPYIHSIWDFVSKISNLDQNNNTASVGATKPFVSLSSADMNYHENSNPAALPIGTPRMAGDDLITGPIDFFMPLTNPQQWLVKDDVFLAQPSSRDYYLLDQDDNASLSSHSSASSNHDSQHQEKPASAITSSPPCLSPVTSPTNFLYNNEPLFDGLGDRILLSEQEDEDSDDDSIVYHHHHRFQNKKKKKKNERSRRLSTSNDDLDWYKLLDAFHADVACDLAQSGSETDEDALYPIISSGSSTEDEFDDDEEENDFGLVAGLKRKRVGGSETPVNGMFALHLSDEEEDLITPTTQQEEDDEESTIETAVRRHPRQKRRRKSKASSFTPRYRKYQKKKPNNDKATSTKKNHHNDDDKKKSSEVSAVTTANTPNSQLIEFLAEESDSNTTVFQHLTESGIDWCRYCGTTEGVNWRPGPWGKRTLCK